MADSTYEEARRCPRCDEPGFELEDKRGPRGSRIHVIQCRNSRCQWNQTNYTVQVNADGTIPEPTLDRPKNFPVLPTRSDAEVARMLDRITGGDSR